MLDKESPQTRKDEGIVLKGEARLLIVDEAEKGGHGRALVLNREHEVVVSLLSVERRGVD